jgi:hypothetical protein
MHALCGNMSQPQVGNVPTVPADPGYATLFQNLQAPMARDDQLNYEEAIQAAAEPTQGFV